MKKLSQKEMNGVKGGNFKCIWGWTDTGLEPTGYCEYDYHCTSVCSYYYLGSGSGYTGGGGGGYPPDDPPYVPPGG